MLFRGVHGCGDDEEDEVEDESWGEKSARINRSAGSYYSTIN